MTRGQGSLFFATRTGVRMTGVPLTATSPPAPTWWAHHCACAWVAAWLTVRGRTMLGSREVLADPNWSGEVTWRDAKGFHRRGHRPDLVAVHPKSGGGVPLEVELAQKSANRLRAILDLHAAWRLAGKTGGVLYICADTDGCSRIRRVAAHVGLRDNVGRGGLRLDCWRRSRRRQSSVPMRAETKRSPRRRRAPSSRCSTARRRPMGRAGARPASKFPTDQCDRQPSLSEGTNSGARPPPHASAHEHSPAATRPSGRPPARPCTSRWPGTSLGVGPPSGAKPWPSPRPEF